MGFPDASVIRTAGPSGNATLIFVTWWLPWYSAIRAPFSRVAVATNGTMARAGSTAEMCWAPTVEPRIHSTDAIPSAPVVAGVAVKVPPPITTGNVIEVPRTEMAYPSRTRPARWIRRGVTRNAVLLYGPHSY